MRPFKKMLSALLSCLLLFTTSANFTSCAAESREVSSARNAQTSPAKGDRLWNYKRGHFNMYSIKDEITIGDQIMNQQIQEMKRKNIPVDPPKHANLKNRLNRIVSRLGRVSDIPYLPYEIHVFDKPDVVNASALPGGKMAVFTGLFDPQKGMVSMNNDSEIAAVLAHEMAHASMRHSTRRLTTYNNLGFLGNIISLGIGSQIGLSAQRIFSQVYSAGTLLYFPTYSRSHEKEADRVGLYYMARAGYDPQAAINIWEKAQQKGKKGDKKTHFFDTHPSYGDRAARLKKYLSDAYAVKNQEIQTQTTRQEMRREK